MMKYYAIDIFLGRGHPHHKIRKEKLNPMQRLAYLSLTTSKEPFGYLKAMISGYEKE